MATANEEEVEYKPGFPKEIIVSGQVDPKFVCFLCNNLLRTPLQSFCGHRFCKACVKNLLAGKDSELCPLCKNEDSENEFSTLKLDQMFPDNAIKRDFNAVQAKCINPGCSWTGTLKHYEDHDSKCEFQSIQCRRCNQLVPIKSRGFHESNECPERPWTCDFCQITLAFKFSKGHLKSECPYAPIDCRHCKVKGIPRAQLSDHYETSCSGKRQLCPIPRCNDGVLQEELLRHKQENVVNHVDNVSETVKQVEEKVANYRTENQHNQDRVRQVVEDINKKMAEMEARTPMARGSDDFVGSQGAVGMSSTTSNLGDIPVGDIDQRLQIQDAKIATFESIASVLNTEILKCLNKIEDQAKRIGEDANQIVVLNGAVRELENSNRAKDELIARLQTEITRFTDTSYDGVFVWKIENVNRKRQDAMSGRVTSIYSPPFFSSRTGYKMSARLYFNGDGMGRGSHISLYFVIMKGEYDALQRWPFRQKVTLMLLDQNRREHVIDAFRPDPSSSSFKQPVSDMNIASGCPLFCPLSTLDNVGNKAYIKNDTMYIKVVVDTSDLV